MGSRGLACFQRVFQGFRDSLRDSGIQEKMVLGIQGFTVFQRIYCYKCQVDMPPLAIVPILPLTNFLPLSETQTPNCCLGSRLCGNGGTPAQFFGTNYFLPNPKVFSLVGTGTGINEKVYS